MKHFAHNLVSASLAYLLTACDDSQYRRSAKAEMPKVPDKAQTMDEINAEYRTRNLTHFQTYLAACPENEIRCLWFLRNELQVGMIMKVDLNAHTVYTVREVFNHALQAQQTLPLNPQQVTLLEGTKLELQINETSKTVDFTKAVHVAYWHQGVRQTRSYLRVEAPRVISDIYATCGFSCDDEPTRDK